MLDYRKEKTGRVKSTRSPRDLQISHSSGNDQLVADLVGRITSLTDELTKLKSDQSTDLKKYTDSEFNEELIKALDRELKVYKQRSDKDQALYREVNEVSIIELTKKLEEKDLEITNLKQQLDLALSSVRAKEEVISILKSSTTITNNSTQQNFVEKSGEVFDRPSIKETVIDPTDNKVEMESHINVKSDSGSNQSSKLAKLKELGIGG